MILELLTEGKIKTSVVVDTPNITVTKIGWFGSHGRFK